MKSCYIPYPKIIKDSFTDKIFTHFDILLNKIKEDKFVLSVSGGADSVLLLYLFVKYFESDTKRLIIAHVNHNLRKDSKIDENFVLNLGERLRIKTYVKKLDSTTISKGDSTEAWARKHRYDFLNTIMKKSKAKWVVTGHHANDQAETILMNISEKTGLFGLGGMKDINNNIIRPLLPYTKAQLMDLIRKYSIPFFEDSTNKNNYYKRNYIRNNVIAPWLERNGDLIESIIATGRNFKDWQDGMLHFVNDFIKNNLVKNKNNNFFIDKNSFNKIPLFARVCVLQVLTNSIGSLRKPQIETLKGFLSKEAIGNKCYAINGFTLLNDRNRVIIKRKKLKKLDRLELKFGNEYNFDNYVYKVSEYSKNVRFSSNPDDELIDLAPIKNKKLILRYWSSGDRFKPLGMNGTQKISDYLINNKINSFEKDEQTVITADNQIIWVCGHRIDDSVKVKNRTKNILRVRRKLKKIK